MGDVFLFLLAIVIGVIQVALVLAIFEMRRHAREIAKQTTAATLYLRDIRDSVYIEAGKQPPAGPVESGR